MSFAVIARSYHGEAFMLQWSGDDLEKEIEATGSAFVDDHKWIEDPPGGVGLWMWSGCVEWKGGPEDPEPILTGVFRELSPDEAIRVAEGRSVVGAQAVPGGRE